MLFLGGLHVTNMIIRLMCLTSIRPSVHLSVRFLALLKSDVCGKFWLGCVSVSCLVY